ncbi:MAG: DUF4258 domain-containing protein [Acidobacteriota bacterium]
MPLEFSTVNLLRTTNIRKPSDRAYFSSPLASCFHPCITSSQDNLLCQDNSVRYRTVNIGRPFVMIFESNGDRVRHNSAGSPKICGQRMIFLPRAGRQMARPDRSISSADIRLVIFEGGVIEDHPEDQRGHNCLLFSFDVVGRAIHVICSPKIE